MFAANGYKATSVQAIVSRAHLNKRMLYHYFGSKRGLYNAVIQHNFSEILGRVAEVSTKADPANSPTTVLAITVGTYFDALLTHPRYVRFLLWEEATGWSVLNQLSHDALDRLRAILISIIQEGIHDNIFDKNLQPEIAWFNIIGVPVFYFSYRPRLQAYSDEDLASPLAIMHFRQELIRFALLGLGTSREVAERAIQASCATSTLGPGAPG